MQSSSVLLTFLFVALFALALGVLLFELTLTRIFSILLWYDYAFMAISIAFFGLGIGALTVHILKNKIKAEHLPSKILQSSIAFAVSVPIFLFVIGYIIPPSTSYIYLFYLASSIPFFFAGAAIALIYLTMPKEITKLYFIDLAGAALAALILDPLLKGMGAESVLLLTALIAVGSSFVPILFLDKKYALELRVGNRSKYIALGSVIACVALLGANITSVGLLAIPPGENKGLQSQLSNPSIEHLSAEWNSFSRVDVTKDKVNPDLVATITIDADANTPIFRWNVAGGNIVNVKSTTLNNNQTTLYWHNPIENEGNVNYIEAKLRVLGQNQTDNHAGIFWTLTNSSKEYYAFLRSDTVAVYVPDTGEIRSPTTISRENGKWFTLSVSNINNTINVLLDGIPKIQIPITASSDSSASHTISKVGIRSFNSAAEFEPIKLGTVATTRTTTTSKSPDSGIRLLSSDYVTSQPYTDIEWVKEYMDYLPYEISKTNSTLVIGSGGGQDILVALAGGSKNVTAVELNPLVVSAVKKFGGSSAGNLYNRKDVELFIDDGRRFISSTDSKFDKIVLKLVDSWAAQLAGGYALSENYLYTVEAFKQYLRHLEGDGGMLVMVRWNTELPRLMPLVVESLRQQQPTKSIQEISKQILVVEDRPGLFFGSAEKGPLYPVLLVIKNSPFTTTEVTLIGDRIARDNATLIVMPGGYIQPPYDELLNRNITQESNQQLQSVSYKAEKNMMALKIPTDDSPFYFAKEQIPNQMKLLLVTVIGVSAVLALLLIYYSKTNKIRLFTSSRRLHILFVIFIGLGFMFLEITFIQKFLLLLGTPIMALAIILFSILLSTGVGAYLSGRLFKKNPYKAIEISIPILVGMVLVYYICLPAIIDSSMVLDLLQRAAISFALLFPVGLLMGFQFPSITRMASSSSSSDVTLLWGVNVIASVIGTVLTAISSMVIGFNGNLLIGIGFYLGALISAIAAMKMKPETSEHKEVLRR